MGVQTNHHGLKIGPRAARLHTTLEANRQSKPVYLERAGAIFAQIGAHIETITFFADAADTAHPSEG